MDTSSVFHRDMLDTGHRGLFHQPWLFETDEQMQSFDYEAEACEAQRQYRIRNGFDPITGEAS